MAKNIKKSANVERLEAYEIEFRKVQKTVAAFEDHDRSNELKRRDALHAVYDFGQQIRTEPSVLHSFVEKHSLPWNKVTQKNPYNALVHLAFSADMEKSWKSKCSTVLAYAHNLKINMPFAKWLGSFPTISDCYQAALEHFQRKSTNKAGRARTLRLEKARKELISKAGAASPVEGLTVSGTQPGFFRSLVYFDGKDCRVVDVRDNLDQAAVDAYLLDLGRIPINRVQVLASL